MKFEDAGRAMDREIEKLMVFLRREVKPKTRRETAAMLRRASDRLAKLAEKLEKAQD